MIRSLLTFALIALLMTPQFVIAKDHHDAMIGAAGSETLQSDSHTCAEMDTDCGQADIVLCCDMIMGHCTTAMSVPGSVTFANLADGSSGNYLPEDLVLDGQSPSFDPPPPRV